jgi:cobalt-zinc-cadmium efflux system membrane fusion protein
MASRSTIIVLSFAAGAAIFALAPGLSTTVQRVVGIGTPARTAAPAKPAAPEPASGLLPMSEEQIKLAQIELANVGPAKIAKRLAVPGTIIPNADLIAHVSVKLSGTVAELRRNIGDDVIRDEVIAVLESREVADAKSEYLAARLTDDLAQDLANRDKTLWAGKAIPEQQFLRSRNAAAQSSMKVNIARQKLMALGLADNEIATLPETPEARLRRQDVRATIAGRVVERKVELGTAVGRDNLETELFVIVDLSRVWVDLSVAFSDLPLIKEGQSVKISARGLSETTSGKIIFVSPLVDKDTRTARVVAEIQNGELTWRPGSFVTAGIALSERNVPVVAPATAIQKVEGRSVVFVRTKDGFEKRDVILGQKEDQALEIISGLTSGETIATTNTFALKAELSKPKDED